MENNERVKSEPPRGAGREGTAHRRSSSVDTERPASAQRMHEEEKGEPADTNDEEMSEDDSDPGQQIVDFDWQDLLERYHQAIANCEANEAQLMQEWTSLMNVTSQPVVIFLAEAS